MRKDQFFHLNQAMQGFGIQQIYPQDLSTGKASNAIARIYDEMTKISGLPPTHNYYYTYGWSGLLSTSQRYQEAEGLLIALHQLIQQFKSKGITPKVRLIGYSHGGNVCLNIAAIHRDKYPEMKIHIDELIMIGLPVQIETDKLIASPIFERAYHFYSKLDRIQRIDFFSFNRFFSGRLFKSRRKFKVPKKLTQVRFKVTRLRPTKRNKRRQRKNALDLSNPANISGQRRLLRDASPGHIEMWFFGWTPGKYRNYFPLAPLPALVMVPYVMAELKKIEDKTVNPHPITVDIRPELGITLIKQRKRNRLQIVVPFISTQNFEQLKSYARSVKPESYTIEEYQQHIEQALKQARKDYDKQIAKERPRRRRRRRRFRRTHERASAIDRHYKFLEPLG